MTLQVILGKPRKVSMMQSLVQPDPAYDSHVFDRDITTAEELRIQAIGAQVCYCCNV